MVENYGDSELAKRFGVKRYPAIFVDDVLVATPKDFGWFGKGEGKDEGRYAPLKSAASHERFRADLARMLQLVLAGDTASARSQAASAVDTPVPRLPSFALTDLEGGANVGRASPHVGEPAPAVRAGVEPMAVVGDLDGDLTARVGDERPHDERVSPGVLEDVGHRLLEHSEHLQDGTRPEIGNTAHGDEREPVRRYADGGHERLQTYTPRQQQRRGRDDHDGRGDQSIDLVR